jgi:hypothetical protein
MKREKKRLTPQERIAIMRRIVAWACGDCMVSKGGCAEDCFITPIGRVLNGEAPYDCDCCDAPVMWEPHTLCDSCKAFEHDLELKNQRKGQYGKKVPND